MTRTLARLTALAAIGLLGAACSIGAPTTHTLVLAAEEPGGIKELPLTITDESGHLRDAGQQIGWPPPGPDGPVWNPPGEPQKVLVTWTGGACDTNVEMTLKNQGNGFAIAMTTAVEDVPCDAIGIERSVVLTFDRPVAAALVTVTS